MSLTQSVEYRVEVPYEDAVEVRKRLEGILAAEELPVERRVKIRKKRRFQRHKGPKTKTVNVRPLIYSADFQEDDATLAIRLMTVDGVQGKLKEILPMVASDPSKALVTKLETFVRDGEGWVPLGGDWSNPHEGGQIESR